MEGANRTPQVNQQLAAMVVDNDGSVLLEVDELSHIELAAREPRQDICSWGVNGTAPPIGSTLQNGTFYYWQLGPGFLGDYQRWCLTGPMEPP